MTISTTTTLMATITLLKRADSRMPMASTPVMISVSSRAGKSKTAPVERAVPVTASKAHGADPSARGMGAPINLKSFCRYLLAPCATEAALTPYSSPRSQPTHQAASSPKVAYAYV
jgi:hypothetical protein